MYHNYQMKLKQKQIEYEVVLVIMVNWWTKEDNTMIYKIDADAFITKGQQNL